MNAKTPILTLALVSAALVAPLAAAQQNTGSAWHGQDSEFGSIRTPYTAEVNGQRADIEAKIVLRKNFEDKDSRFFMFAWSTKTAPALDVDYTNLIRSDTGQELPCYQRQEDGGEIKCFVDLKDMPPAGTEIIMRGTVGSNKAGNFQVGAVVVPFTYTWMRVQMSNGLDAELYGYTMVNVQEPTSKGPGPKLGGGGNLGVPGFGAFAAIAAVAVVAIGLAAMRRRNQ